MAHNLSPHKTMIWPLLALQIPSNFDITFVHSIYVIGFSQLVVIVLFSLCIESSRTRDGQARHAIVSNRPWRLDGLTYGAWYCYGERCRCFADALEERDKVDSFSYAFANKITYNVPHKFLLCICRFIVHFSDLQTSCSIDNSQFWSQTH